jgi:hypothetical protein
VASLSGGVDAGIVEGDFKSSGEIAAEVTVGIGFFTAKAVMQMSGVKHEAQFPAPPGERTEEGDRVGSPGNTDGESHAGL